MDSRKCRVLIFPDPQNRRAVMRPPGGTMGRVAKFEAPVDLGNVQIIDKANATEDELRRVRKRLPELVKRTVMDGYQLRAVTIQRNTDASLSVAVEFSRGILDRNKIRYFFLT